MNAHHHPPAARPASARARLQQLLTRWGFQVPLLAFALRTAAAAFGALALAYALGLEHPHWAAMSAWAASQVLREQLLSRGLHRVAGSMVGVAFAVVLVLAAQGSIWVLAVGLALWSAACAFWGNLQRGYRTYGAMLAGYSAAMVVLLHQGPVHSIWAFAGDRMATVLTGVVVALGLSWFFAPRRQASALIGQNRQALAQVLQAAAQRLRRAPVSTGQDPVSLVSQLAKVDELLELYPEGSRTARRAAQAMHWQQQQALEVVYQLSLDRHAEGAAAPAQADDGLAPAAFDLRQAAQPVPVEPLAQTLHHVSGLLRQTAESGGADAHGLDAALRHAIALCEVQVASLQPGVQTGRHTVPAGLHALYLLLQEMRRALRVEEEDLALGDLPDHPAQPAASDLRRDTLPLHRDWVGARQAAVRAGGTLLALGMVWAATGWTLVAFGMLGLSVMLLVFSGFENPQRTMRFVARGQVIGAALALVCQWLVWPLATSGWQMVLMLAPFALLGGLLFAHQRTAAGGMDTNMVLFILLAPVFPYALQPGHSLGMAGAIVAGPVVAWLVYRLVYPTNALQRMRTLAAMMVAEVPAMAQRMVQVGKPSLLPSLALPVDDQWQGRLSHRMLRLQRWADKTGHDSRHHIAHMALALRFMQTSMLHLQQWRADTILATPALRRADRLAELALRRTVQWGEPQAEPGTADQAVAAWLALASQRSALPPALVQQATELAQCSLPRLHQARADLAK